VAAEKDHSSHFFLPAFIQQFLPDRHSLETLLDYRYFTRERRLTLATTLALLLNLVRPGERLVISKSYRPLFLGHRPGLSGPGNHQTP
jgi:hypothetical protein